MKKEVAKLNRISGQIAGLTRMIENEEGCEKVLDQFSAVKGALNGVLDDYLSSNLQKCFKTSQAERAEKIIKQISKK
jgi:DNA-binding FrmR family transcriptional regulator